MRRFLFLIGLISLSTWAMAQKNTTEKVLSMRTTACFGTCPVFEFTLYADRSATYIGKDYTEREGVWQTKVSRKLYKKLLRTFRKSDFFNYQEEYTSSITDMPTIFLYYNDGEKEKEIENYDGAPKSLTALEKEVMAFIEKLEWSKVSK